MTEHAEIGGERWVAVAGWEDRYEISDHGRVRSLFGHAGKPRKSPLIRKNSPRGKYLGVTLYRGEEVFWIALHHHVAITFIGPRPKGKQAAHEDGNPHHNHVANLSWKTPKENAADKWRHGTMPIGERHHGAKLTEDQVREIRSSTDSTVEAAKKFGIHPSNVGYIRRRTAWKHVQ